VYLLVGFYVLPTPNLRNHTKVHEFSRKFEQKWVITLLVKMQIHVPSKVNIRVRTFLRKKVKYPKGKIGWLLQLLALLLAGISYFLRITLFKDQFVNKDMHTCFYVRLALQ